MTLIKSCLVNLPTYYLSLFEIPKGVAKRLEKIQRDFLWEGNGNLRKIHLVKWVEVRDLRENGGLGIYSIRDRNHALLTKWLWRFASEEKALWRKVSTARYGVDDPGEWRLGNRAARDGSSVVKPLMKIGNEGGKIREMFLRGIRLHVGNRLRVLFWKDIWVGERPLMEVFPRLFRVAINKEAMVSEYYREANGSHQWIIPFRRTLQDFEVASHQALLGILRDVRLWIEEKDKWIWSFEPVGSFSVKSIFWSAYAVSSDSSPNCNLAWNNKIPLRIQFFL